MAFYCQRCGKIYHTECIIKDMCRDELFLRTLLNDGYIFNSYNEICTNCLNSYAMKHSNIKMNTSDLF